MVDMTRDLDLTRVDLVVKFKTIIIIIFIFIFILTLINLCVENLEFNKLVLLFFSGTKISHKTKTDFCTVQRYLNNFTKKLSSPVHLFPIYQTLSNRTSNMFRTSSDDHNSINRTHRKSSFEPISHDCLCSSKSLPSLYWGTSIRLHLCFFRL
jgi:hypothetical protein